VTDPSWRGSFVSRPRLDGSDPFAHPAKLVGASVEALIEGGDRFLLFMTQITVRKRALVLFRTGAPGRMMCFSQSTPSAPPRFRRSLLEAGS
jgi:hypothetical protein